MRRARELLAQIVLFGVELEVEFGVEFEVGIDGAPVGALGRKYFA